jgi:hypothetical protein
MPSLMASASLRQLYLHEVHAYLQLCGRDELRKFQVQPLPISKEVVFVILIENVPVACRLVVIFGFLRFRNRRTALSSKCLRYFGLLASRRGNMVPRVLRENVLIILKTLSKFFLPQEKTGTHCQVTRTKIWDAGLVPH